MKTKLKFSSLKPSSIQYFLIHSYSFCEKTLKECVLGKEDMEGCNPGRERERGGEGGQLGNGIE